MTPHRPVIQTGTASRTAAHGLLRWTLSLAALALCAGAPITASAADPHAGHTAPAGVKRSEQNYVLPDVAVTDASGKRMSLRKLLDDGRPVMLNFIYTTCNAICPVTSQVFLEVREKLGARRGDIHMVSVSIDPEQDTPRRLEAYAQRFGAAGAWTHLTSSAPDAVAIQRAFGAWQGDKMNHLPITYLRQAPGKPWIRLDGFYSPSALVTEVTQILPRQQPGNPG